MKEKLKGLASSIWFWVVGIGAFLLAYCYYLLQRNRNLQTQIDMGKHREEIEKHTERLKNAKKESDSAVGDYKRIRDEYIASDDESGGTSH